MLKKVSFSSDQLPPDLDDSSRYALWHEIHNSQIASLDYRRSEALPFKADISALLVGRLAVGEMSGTINSAARSRSNIKEDDGSGHCLFINTGNAMMSGEQRGREFAIGIGEAVLISNSEPVRMIGGPTNSWTSVMFPDGALSASGFQPDDRISLSAGAQSIDLLDRYVGILRSDVTIGSQALLEHVTGTLVGLVQIALAPDSLKGASWASEGAVSGLRAARLATVEKIMAEQFCDPQISAQAVALELRLSPRYVHELLEHTGRSFGEWILELRLKKAMELAQNRAFGHMRISEIALNCGFNDISYFNRCFRRRFGCKPSDMR